MRDIIIVDDNAIVTPASGTAPTITGATVLITLDRLVDNEFNFDDYLCSEDNLTFGKMESAHLEFVLINDVGIPYLQDLILKVYEYTDGDSSTLNQIGRFTVLTDEKASDRLTRTINCYDDIYYLRDFDITDWYYNIAYRESDVQTVKQLRDSLFEWLNDPDGGDFPITQQTTTLVNDNFPVYRGIESDVITFDFFMSRLIEFNGCFGHIGNTGVFEYVSLPEYSGAPVKTLTADDIIPPVEFEDYKVWGIGYVDVYDRDNIRLYRVGSSSMKHPSRYRIIDSFIFYNYGRNDSDVKAALMTLKQQIDVLRYVPFETDAKGDYSLKVGDRIDIYSSYTQFEDDEGQLVNFEFPTYILELHRTGIQQPFDTYAAKGEKKQPKYKLTQGSNWHSGDSTEGTGTVSVIDDEFKKKFIECIRNIGFRVLNEPSNVSVVYNEENFQVEIKWKDPVDITTNRPVPATWAGTIVVRSTAGAMWHRWDDTCLTLVNSTTRNEYSSTPFIDDDLEYDTQYYYGIFPYDTDGHYRFTKVVSVNTTKPVTSPRLTRLTCEETDITAYYSIPSDFTWDYVKLVYKADSIPTDINDGTAVDITGSHITIKKLAEQTRYYFIIFAKEHDTGREVQSDIEDIKTEVRINIPPFQEYIQVTREGLENGFYEEVSYEKVT